MFRKKIEKTQDKISISLKNWHPEPSWLTPIIVYSVVLISKFIMQILNRVEILHREELLSLHERENRGLITFSNHNALFDDPFLISCFGKVSIVGKRYIAADAQNFFSRKHTGFFFSQGRCVPIVRGAGMQQPGFDYLKKVLSEGGWVHIFPEGTRNRKPQDGVQSNFTHGMAHLILDSKPLVLPFYHFGMEKILPVGGRLPRIGNKVKVIFGKKIDLSEEGLKKIFGESCLEPSNNREMIKKITDWSYTVLKSIEENEINKI